MGLRALQTRKQQQQLSPRVAVSFKWSNCLMARSTGTRSGGQHARPETLHPGTRLLCVRELEQVTEQMKEEDAWREGRKTSGRSSAEKSQDYLLALVLLFTQVSGSYSLISLFGDFFYSLFTLLLHLFHLTDALVPVKVKASKWKDSYLEMRLYSKSAPAVTVKSTSQWDTARLFPAPRTLSEEDTGRATNVFSVIKWQENWS